MAGAGDAAAAAARRSEGRRARGRGFAGLSLSVKSGEEKTHDDEGDTRSRIIPRARPTD